MDEELSIGGSTSCSETEWSNCGIEFWPESDAPGAHLVDPTVDSWTREMERQYPVSVSCSPWKCQSTNSDHDFEEEDFERFEHDPNRLLQRAADTDATPSNAGPTCSPVLATALDLPTCAPSSLVPKNLESDFCEGQKGTVTMTPVLRSAAAAKSRLERYRTMVHSSGCGEITQHEVQKRPIARAYWSTSELYTLIDSVLASTEPSFLLKRLQKADPCCKKTLRHVVYKKANLIQKCARKGIGTVEQLRQEIARKQENARRRQLRDAQ